MATLTLLDDALELADLLKPVWDEIRDGIPDWHPRNDDDADKDADADDDKDKDKDKDADADDDKDVDADKEPDWKSESRKHERRAKQERKDREKADSELAKLRDADKSEQDKALDEAKKAARDEALAESAKERRADRLEVAVTRLASKGVKAGDDDALTKFADPEDALVFIERAISHGDLDESDIFDEDGKVQTDAVTDALADLLKSKPRLAADASAGRGNGSSDAGRGDADTGGDTTDVGKHLASIRRTAK